MWDVRFREWTHAEKARGHEDCCMVGCNDGTCGHEVP